MAPTHLAHSAAHSLLSRLVNRAASTANSVPLASVFALVGSTSSSSGAASIGNYRLGSRSPLSSTGLEKRQQYILAIPTTYDSINTSPAPGTVAGITLGAVGGFILLLYLILLILKQYTGRSIVEKEVIETHHHHRGGGRRSSRSSRGRAQMTERQRVREEVRIERSVSRAAPESVVVEEQEDDIVEVMEEHSPVRPQRKKSGYRTVDPAELGGGSAPRKKLGRR